MNNQFKEVYIFCVSPKVDAKCLSVPTRGAISYKAHIYHSKGPTQWHHPKMQRRQYNAKYVYGMVR